MVSARLLPTDPHYYLNYSYSMPCCSLLPMEPWGLRPTKFQTSVAVPPAPVRVPRQRQLALSVASVTSVANDKDDNEMILGPVHRSPAFVLQLRKTPENLS